MRVDPFEPIYKPLLFKAKEVNEIELTASLIQKYGSLHVCNTISQQLTELIKLRNPSQVLTKIQIENLIEDFLAGETLENYGNWVFFPWLNKLVRALEKEDFISVRTNRNMYKITQEEIDVLSKKKIGIIGLSVGQAIALTAATERICGVMHLADFDVLELGNMNRLSAGIQDIGISKVILAARKIAELDPYIQVTCFTNGARNENMDAFFSQNGPIDILVEECDSIDVKILSRLKAKELGVPVVMDTNDNGMIDIERFDLEPNRPVLHGRIAELESMAPEQLVEKLGMLTVEEKIGYLASIIGMENVSKEMLVSLGEMNKSITGWPQLATASICRGTLSVRSICSYLRIMDCRSSMSICNGLILAVTKLIGLFIS